ITGMTCPNCARHVTEAIQSVPGVSSATVRLEASRASLRWSAGTAPNTLAVIRAVEEAGYGASVAETAECGHGESRVSGWQVNLWVGLLGTVPLMLGEWAFRLGMTRWFQWCSFVLAGTVQILA